MINNNDNHCVEKKTVYSEKHNINIVYNNAVLFLHDKYNKKRKTHNKNIMHLLKYIKYKFTTKN